MFKASEIAGSDHFMGFFVVFCGKFNKILPFYKGPFAVYVVKTRIYKNYFFNIALEKN